MKLNKDTRKMIKVGDVLRTSTEDFVITNLYEFNGGVRITLADKDNRHIYGDALSNWYGTEIIKGDIKWINL